MNYYSYWDILSLSIIGYHINDTNKLHHYYLPISYRPRIIDLPYLI